MNTAAKLSAYGAALAIVAAGGWLAGTAVGPFGAPANEDAGHGDAHSGTVAETAKNDQPGGLASSRGGYTLTPTSTTLTPGTTESFTFRIIGPDGDAVTRFDVEHEKRMHLIVVRRDTSDFQHVHPKPAADGTWTVPLKPASAGTYRAFADFTPSGAQGLTLGVDLFAKGDFDPDRYRTSRVDEVDGYQVKLAGDLVPGKSSKVTLSISQDGRPVTDLSPYLGAYGHLVALRQGDLAYLHVHSDGTPGDGKTRPGPAITFFAEVPSAGVYRLFLDFEHDGVVRTAEFTVPTGAEAGEKPEKKPAAPDEHGTGGEHAGHGG